MPSQRAAPSSAALEVLTCLQSQQRDAGRPLSDPQSQTMLLHLEALYATDHQPMQVVNHAAGMLKAFSLQGVMPDLPLKAQQHAEANILGVLGLAASVKQEEGEPKAAKPAGGRPGRGKAATEKKAKEEVTPTPPARGKGKGRAVKKQPAEDSDEEEYEPNPQPKRKITASKKKPVDDSDVDFAPAHKTKQKAAATKKRKAPAKQERPTDFDSEEEFVVGWESSAPPKAPKKAKYAPINSEQELDCGWTAFPPSIVYKCPEPGHPSLQMSKIAAFDVLDTLLKTKSGLPYAKNADDWRLANPQVPRVLQNLFRQGYRIVILNNNGGIKSALGGKASQNERYKLNDAEALFGVPVTSVLATQNDGFRKPFAGMWRFLSDHLSPQAKPDASSSFYCGDDLELKDSQFAAAAGIEFRHAESIFGQPQMAKTVREPAPKPMSIHTGNFEANTELGRLFLEKEKVARSEGGNRFALAAIKRSAGILANFPDPITSDESMLQRLSDTKYIGESTMDDVRAFVNGEPLSFQI